MTWGCSSPVPWGSLGPYGGNHPQVVPSSTKAATPAPFTLVNGSDPAESGLDFPREPVDGPREVVNTSEHIAPEEHSVGPVQGTLQPSSKRILKETHLAWSPAFPVSGHIHPPVARCPCHPKVAEETIGGHARSTWAAADRLEATFKRTANTSNPAHHRLLALTSPSACLYHPSLAEPWVYPSTHLH